MPPRRTSTRRKKSSRATASTDVSNGLPASEVETGGESVTVKIEETETEILGQVEVSNPNPAGNDGDSADGAGFSSKPVMEELGLENCVVGDANEVRNEDDEPDAGSDKVKEDLRLVSEDVDEKKPGVGVGTNEDGVDCVDDDRQDGSMINDKDDLGQGSENVDDEKHGVEVGKDENGVLASDGSQFETVSDTNYAQQEMAVVRVKILHDNNASIIFKGDGDKEREEIAEISAQESNLNKSPCKNYDLLVVQDGGDGDRKDTAEITFSQESTQVVSTKAYFENHTAMAIEDDVKENGDDEESGGDSEGDDAGNVGDEHPSLFVEDPLPDNKKDKDIEIYVGRLDKNTVEDDLVNVFQRFGELKSTRIVRNSITKKSKGFAFVQFASADQAKRALSELKDGVKVLQQLKHYEIEHIEMIRLPEDPKINGKNKGFAFVEFSTHADAVAAFQRLQKPDAVFGRDISAKVAFAQTPMHPSDEELSQIKASSAKPQPKSQLQKKRVRGGFKVEKKSESSTLKKGGGISKGTSEPKSSKTKGGLNSQQARRNRKDSSKPKITASVAKPQQKVSLKKQSSGVELKAEKQSKLPKNIGESSKEVESSKMKVDLNPQKAKRKRKEFSRQSLKAPLDSRHGDQGIVKKQKFGDEGQSSKTTFKGGNRKRRKALRYEARDEGGIRNTDGKKPFKKQKGNMHGRERDNSRILKGGTRDRKAQDDYRTFARYIDPYAPKYATFDAHNLGPNSMPTRSYREMEPHAGYIEPASANASRSFSGYVQPVVRTQSQHHTVYLEPASSSQSQLHSRYLDRSAITQSHRGYIETTGAPEAQPYRGYHQLQIAHDPYDPRLSRVVRHDGRSTGVLAYVGGPLLPASQARDHTSYYQAAGGYSGAYTTQRRYY